MSEKIKLEGVAQVKRNISKVIERSKAIEEFIIDSKIDAKRRSNRLATMIEGLRKAMTSSDDALGVVAASFTGDLPNDRDWRELENLLLKDSDPGKFEDFLDAMNGILYADADVSDWIRGLESLDLPTIVDYQED